MTGSDQGNVARSTGVGNPPQVFVSHASPDAVVARRIVAALEGAGIRCWIAPRDVPAGAQYADAIVRAISEAPVFLVLLSAHSIASAHVGREVERAGSKARRFLALRLDSAPLTPALEYFLGESQWVDLQAGEAAAEARLLQAILQALGPAMAAATPIPAPPQTSSRPVRIAFVVCTALAIIGILAWRLLAPKAVPVPTPAPSAVAEKSIAVLPFADMSEKHDQEYFGDGMAEEVIDLLAKVQGLTVIGRTSSFQFKGRNEDLRAIGTSLNAAYVLEGSVRQSGDKIRITAQLINTRTGAHVWSDTYDRRLDDVLRLQDAIAAAVAREMQLSVDAGYLGSRGALKDATSYDLMLRARHAGDRWDNAGLDEAIVLLRQALDRDPSSAAVASQLAMMYVREGEAGYLVSTKAFEQARRAADVALALDAKNVLAHNVLARIHIIYDWDWIAAERELEQASARVPGEGGALDTEVLLSLALGRWDDALRQINLAIAQDPLDPKIFFALGELQFLRGRGPEAEAAYRRVLDIHPTFPWAHVSIGFVLLARGDTSSALAEMNQEPVESGRQVGLVAAYHALGRHADSNAALHRLTAAKTGGSAYMVAQAYAYRGEIGDAMRWLERARADKDPFLFYAQVELFPTPLAASPEFTAFLRKMNIPVEQRP